MKIWAALSDAFAGWVLILRGEAGWRERFALSMAGLARALVVFAFVAFLAVALASTNFGMPSLFGVVAAMVVLALPVFALLLTLVLTRNMLRSPVPMLDIMVPGLYLVTAFLMVEGLLALLGPVVLVSWLAVAYMLFRLARAATPWNRGVSAGFGVLTVAVLVAMRLALYMVSAAVSPA